MKNRYPGLLPKIHLWIDVILLNLSFLLAYLIRFGDLSRLLDNQYLNLLLIANLLWVFAIYLFKTYSFSRLSYHINTQIGDLFKSILFHAVTTTCILYLMQQGADYSRKQFVLTYVLFFCSATVLRIAAIFSLKLYRQAGYNYHRYAIIGRGEVSDLIRGFYSERKELGFRFCGAHNLPGEKYIEAIESLIHKEQLDFIYCCLSNVNDEQVRDIIRLGERSKTHVRLVPDFRGFMTNMATIEYHDMYPVIHVSTKPFSSFRDQTFKRVFDVAFSTTVMITGAPIFLLIMVAVKLTSPGPVFFKQQRCGRWGKLFDIYKFRSMYVDAEKLGLKHSQGDSDPRITKLGKFLRRSRLDELPQFINVMRGEMSIVGPRPLYKYDVDMLMEAEPHDFQRLLTVKPGVTSIGQIRVGYADTVAKNVERLKYDLQYLKSYSLVNDVHLILRTLQVMVLGRGR